MTNRCKSMASMALALTISTASAEAERHGKTIKQCNEELQASQAALFAAGESPSRFIHDCWWHTQAGQKTPVGSQASKPDETAAATLEKAKAAIAKAQAEAAAAEKDAARARREAVEAREALHAATSKAPAAGRELEGASRRSIPMTTTPTAKLQREPRRVARLYLRTARPWFIVRRFSPTAGLPRAARTVIPAKARPVQTGVRPEAQGGSVPFVEIVPVHIAGVAQPLRWPVFPQDVQQFRYNVNHPIVPGMTWTP